MQENIEKIRQKIGIDKLDESQRRRLFIEFVEHGGQVLTDKRLSHGKILRTASTTEKKEEKPSIFFNEPQEEVKSTSTGKTVYRSRPVVRATGKFRLSDRIHLYFKGLRLKVLAVTGTRLRKSFIIFANKNVRGCMTDLNIITGSFLVGVKSIKQAILKASRGNQDTFYEFILRLANLYNEQEFSTITHLLSNRSIPPVNQLYIFKDFFKRLYILGQFPDLCRLYIQKALDEWATMHEIEPSLIQKLNQQIRIDIDVIFNHFYPQLHIVLCLMAKSYYPLYSQKLDDFLEVTEKDKIGYITKLEKKRHIEMLKRQREYYEKKREKTTNTEQADEISIPRHVQRGFELIEELTTHNEGSPIQIQGRINQVEPNDKMHRTAQLLEIFETEYSFLLTSSKVVFNIDYREQKKIDIKEDLNHAYLLFCEALEECDNYFDIMGEIHHTESNPRFTTYQKEKILDSLGKKRLFYSRRAREKITEAMKQIETTLSYVITDFNSTKRLLQNPDDKLIFDINIDGEKRLNGKEVIEAIIETFLFASAFVFLLNFGELSGSGIYVESNQD